MNRLSVNRGKASFIKAEERTNKRASGYYAHEEIIDKSVCDTQNAFHVQNTKQTDEILIPGIGTPTTDACLNALTTETFTRSATNVVEQTI